MKKLHSTVKKAGSFGFGIGMGLVAALTVTTVLSAGLTSLVVNGRIEEGTANTLIFLIRVVSVLVGGLIGTGLGKEKLLQIIGLVSAGYLIVLVGIGIIFYDGLFQNFGTGLLSVVLGALIACFIKLKPQGRRSRATRHVR